LARLQRRASWSRGGFIFIFLIASTAAVVWAKAQAAPPPSTTILNHLNQAISWYRRVAGLDVAAGQPSDTLYLENARNSAVEALQLAFQSASAQATLLAQQKNSGANANNAASSDQTPQQQQGTIAKALADATAHVADMQSQIADLNDQIAKATAKTRPQLVSQRDALQGELDLEKTIQDSLQKIASVANNETAGSGLSAQIAQLKQSVPEVFATAKEASASGGQSSKASAAQNTGLFGEASILFGQMRDMHDIDQLMSDTLKLRDTAEKLDAPLKDSLKTMLQQGQDIVNRPDTTDPAETAATQRDFTALTTQFKQAADAAVPLRQEIIVLDQCHGELQEWRNSINVEYKRVLVSLLTRVGFILLALAMLFGLSQLWRHGTYKYIHDARRRRQLTLIRRFVIGFLMGIVVVAGFITEFSSLATFAGFLTAGIAVALQTVILSLAAYFFLVGRYGVRIGDRLTVSGVTGDVVEIGLVRLYLTELAGTGIDLYPTGRVVVFSNSVMFQTAPFFKQLPGTAYAWHEVALMVAPGADAAKIEQKLLDTVTSVYAEYQHTIDRQHALVERILDASVAAPVPKATLHFIEGGLELTVRYPVEIPHSGDIDDKVTRKLMEVIASDEELKKSVVGSPTLRAAIKA
jgi:small-conductance mechanosensitive channel